MCQSFDPYVLACTALLIGATLMGVGILASVCIDKGFDKIEKLFG